MINNILSLLMVLFMAVPAFFPKPEGKAVFPTGSIDASTNQTFEKRLSDILSSGTTSVMLVLTNVKYINSTGLGTIVKCVDTFREKGGAACSRCCRCGIWCCFRMS